MKLYIYIIRRLLLLIPVIIGVTLITFYLSHFNINLLISEYEGKIHTAAERALVIRELHLNGPFYAQYLYYLGALFTGNWGFVSPGDSAGPGSPVVTVFMQRFPPTAELAIIAVLLILAMGFPLGVLSAVRKDRPADHATRLGAMTAVSLPTFWLGLLVLIMLGPTSPIPSFLRLLGTGQMDWSQYAITAAGTLAPFVSPTNGLSRPTGFLLIDTLVYGDLPAFFNALWYVFWPALVVALTSFGVIIRFMRSSMLENLGLDYIRTARSKGVPEQFVIKKHARRNALGASTTVMGLIFVALLAGVVVTETVFSWPGMGRWLYLAAYNTDMVSVMATTFVFTLVVVSGNLIVDIFYSYLDPRVRLE